MNLRILVLLIISLVITACATSGTTSFVAKEITQVDAEILTNDIISYLEKPLPPASTTLILEAPSQKQGQADVLTPLLIEKLRVHGYGVTEIKAKTDSAQTEEKGTTLRYLAFPFRNGIVLRLQYEQNEASRYYPRDTAGSLITEHPFTVRTE